MKFDFYIKSKEDLIQAVKTFGFLPFFKNPIEGFSISEHIAPEVWFPDEGEGIWEWKGPVIKESGCAYGKFFKNKAVFIDKKFFPDFANFRRDGYDYDSRVDEGIANYNETALYSLVQNNAPVLSKDLKRMGGSKGFDVHINALQHKCYVLINDFVYSVDKTGKKYGWGIAEYTTPELFFGKEFRQTVYDKDSNESFEIIFEHIKNMLSRAKEEDIKKLLI